jgi:hypothetical protein
MACCSRGQLVKQRYTARASCDALLPDLVSVRIVGCSTRIYVDNGEYRELVRFSGVLRWAAAGLLYAPRDDEQPAGARRERHIVAEDAPRRNRPLI